MKWVAEVHIQGVRLIEHAINPDHRGSLSTVHRVTETGSFPQWNCIRSGATVLRGLHAHLSYDELYIPIHGRMFLLLKDARINSPSFGAEISFWSEEIEQKSIFVPSGVAHGVYFATEAILFYGLSQIWNGDGEFGCRWNDVEIKTEWPAHNPILSERDAAAGTFSDLAGTLVRTSRQARP